MAQTKTTKKVPSRYRLSVPQHDISVNDWCKMQDNLSFSLRTIIKEYIEANGMTDPTCVEVVEVPKVGRPKKGAEIKPVGINTVEEEFVEDEVTSKPQEDVKKPVIEETEVISAIKEDDDDDTDEGIDAINRLMNRG